ncbi:MAG: transcriptional regulator, partial [Vulcanococcus sp.]
MLEGKALLDKARSLSNRPEDQIARACGYVGP